MFCRRAETQAFGCKAEQLRREDIEQGAPVIEHEYKTKRSKGADYYIENIGHEYDFAPARQNGADGAHGIIEHSEQKADAERMQKDGLALTVNKFMVEGLDGIKYTFNNGHLAAEPKTAATNFIRALDTIPSLMATYEKEKKQFTRDIPTFEQQIAAVWPKEEELKRLKAEAESLTRKIQLDIAQKQQEMQAKTADNGNGLKIENAEVVDEVVRPSKSEPLSAASGNQEEPPKEREHVVPPPESDFIRNHILLVRSATNMKAKGPKL